MDCHCFDWETWVSKAKFYKVFTQPGISRAVGEGEGKGRGYSVKKRRSSIGLLLSTPVDTECFCSCHVGV